jgi:hypothetical protein
LPWIKFVAGKCEYDLGVGSNGSGAGFIRDSTDGEHMTTRIRGFLSALALCAALAAGSMAAHAQTAPGSAAGGHDAHHPAGSSESKAAAPSSGQMGDQMMGDQMMGGQMMGGDMGRMMSMMHGGGMMGGMPFEHVEGRLAFLKTELKIAPAQEPQWGKFADAFRSVAKSAQGMHRQMMGGGHMMGGQATTVPQRLDAYEKMLNVRLDAVRTMKAAFDPLYASLSDEQKKTADELVGGRMGLM